MGGMHVDSVKEALSSIGNNKEYSTVIQTDITTNSFEMIASWLFNNGFKDISRYGIHNAYGYIDDNEIKMDEEWQNNMLTLELELAKLSPYNNIAVFTHIIAKKI